MENNNDFFILENKDDMLFLTMNAPENNLMTNEFFINFENIFEELEKKYSSDNKVKGLVITGAGRHFSVGSDLKSLFERTCTESYPVEKPEDLPEVHVRQKHAFTGLWNLHFPVVSVIKGFCIGSGSEIAINSHIRICESNARIGQPESALGIIPGLGGLARTAQVCGSSEALEMVFTGELITPENAYNKSWADIVCEKKAGMQKAIDLINFINSLDIQFDPEDVPEYVNEFMSQEG